MPAVAKKPGKTAFTRWNSRRPAAIGSSRPSRKTWRRMMAPRSSRFSDSATERTPGSDPTRSSARR